MMDTAKRTMGHIFSGIFLIVALALVVMSGVEFVRAFFADQEQGIIGGIVRAINTAVISLATFELGLGIGKEYTVPEAGHGLYPVVRRTVTRFVSVVCIALVLEGLIMVIKYSQLDLAGNLYYPVAIVLSSSVLLMGLGVFIHLTRADSDSTGTRAHGSRAGGLPVHSQPQDAERSGHRTPGRRQTVEQTLIPLQRALRRRHGSAAIVTRSSERAVDPGGGG